MSEKLTIYIMDQNEIKGDEYSELIRYFLDEFPLDLIFEGRLSITKQEKIAVECLNRITDIQTIFERLNHYPIYFNKFYVKDKDIPETEALEYHIHSYLNDFYSLREKIIRLLGYIKHQLREFNIDNPEDVEKLLKHLENQTNKGLESVVKVRGGHVHDISVRDPEISKAKIILQAIKISGESWDSSAKTIAEKRYLDIIEVSKEKYINKSKKNIGELNKFKNFFACRLGHIITFLYGHDISRFKKAIEKEMNSV